MAEDLPGGEWRRIQKSKGYNWILVNGEITFEDGKPTGALPGRFFGMVAADQTAVTPPWQHLQLLSGAAIGGFSGRARSCGQWR